MRPLHGSTRAAGRNRNSRDANSRVHALFVLQFDTGHVNGMNYERRIARILLLGIISGFPWVLIGSSLSLWLKEDGISRSTIGWAGLIFGVYAFNFLWAPLIDRIQLPWLSVRLGHRRTWVVTLQAVILVCLILWSAVEPTANLTGVIAIGLVIAVASATQDITIDACGSSSSARRKANRWPRAPRPRWSAGGRDSSSAAWSRWRRPPSTHRRGAGQSRFSGRPPFLVRDTYLRDFGAITCGGRGSGIGSCASAWRSCETASRSGPASRPCLHSSLFHGPP